MIKYLEASLAVLCPDDRRGAPYLAELLPQTPRIFITP